MIRPVIPLACLVLAACSAYRVPPPLAGPVTARRLGVASIVTPQTKYARRPGDVGEFVTRLREDLVATTLFDDVRVDHPTAPVAIETEFEQRHCFTEPLLTVVTVGIVPTPGCYHSGYRLVVRDATGSRS